MTLRVAWMYPELLNTYGDQGNITALRWRAERRQIDVQIGLVATAQELQALDVDIIFLGGAQDHEQDYVATDLLAHGDALLAALHNGATLFAVCAGFQLLGKSYTASNGQQIVGLGLIDAYTVAASSRITGYAASRTNLGDVGTVVGFENHAGRTYLQNLSDALGNVILGAGNNGIDKTEGALVGNIVATYLHGPVLPANPRLADYLIRRGLARHGIARELEPLDDTHELAVHALMLKRAQLRIRKRTTLQSRFVHRS